MVNLQTFKDFISVCEGLVDLSTDTFKGGDGYSFVEKGLTPNGLKIKYKLKFSNDNTINNTLINLIQSDDPDYGGYILDTNVNFDSDGNKTFQVWFDDEDDIRQIPNIKWAKPANVANGTLLSTTQLNATCNTVGVITYNKNINDAVSTGRTLLIATFTPTDLDSFTIVTKTVILKVN